MTNSIPISWFAPLNKQLFISVSCDAPRSTRYCDFNSCQSARPAPSPRRGRSPRAGYIAFLPTHKARRCKSQTQRQKARIRLALFAAWLLLAHCGWHSLQCSFRTPPPVRLYNLLSAITSQKKMQNHPRGQIHLHHKRLSHCIVFAYGKTIAKTKQFQSQADSTSNAPRNPSKAFSSFLINSTTPVTLSGMKNQTILKARDSKLYVFFGCG